MEDNELDHLAHIAYATFLENIREYAPPLAELQPEWDRMPACMKLAWRNTVAAALAAHSAGNA